MIYRLIGAALALALWAGIVDAQPAFIEIKTGSSSATSVTTSAGLANGLSAGDLIVVCSRWSTEGDSQSVSDSAGGTGSDYNLIVTEPLSTGNSVEIALWYRVLTGSMASGTTFTVTGPNSNTRRIAVSTYNGFSSAAQDGSNSADSGGSAASLAAGAITPGAADALLVGCITSASNVSSWTVDSSYSERDEGFAGRLAYADRTVSSVASYNPTFTPDVSVEMVAVHASFINSGTSGQAPRSMHQFRLR